MRLEIRTYAAWIVTAPLLAVLLLAPSVAAALMAVVPVALASRLGGRRAPWAIAAVLVVALAAGPLTPGAAAAELSASETLAAIVAIAAVASCVDRERRGAAGATAAGVSRAAKPSDATPAAPRLETRLATREALLAQLLELSRSLTSTMTRDQLLTEICAAVGAVLHGAAAVVMLRDGDALEVVCHAGFGAGGPAVLRLPAARSLAGLAMSSERTTAVDDLADRPDTAIVDRPEPRRFRSALSCPVRLDGRSMGVIEAYLPAPRSFGSSEVAVLESLATQVSISLRNDQLAESIRHARRRFETAFQTAPVGLAILEQGGDGQIRLNPAALAMFGLAEARELRMVPLSASADDGVRAAELRSLAACHLPLARALRGERISGEVQSLEVPVRGEVTFLTSAAPILDDRALIEGAIATFADITEVNRLARELDGRRRQAETESARKSRFLSALSHDIRTPANAIGLLAELLDDAHLASESDQRVQRLAKSLRSSAHALVGLVGDVVDYARFESGAVEVELADLALDGLVEEACAPSRAAARDKGLTFVVDVGAARGLVVRSDRAKLTRIVANLASNAVKFTRAGSVRVSAAPRADGAAEVRVRDTGVGLAERDRKLIFDEFTQVENAHRAPGAGSGLGLAIAARLAAMLGGAISVESELGRGSTFTLTLPGIEDRRDEERREPRAAPAQTSGDAAGGARPATSELRGLSVLVVEDHEPSREALSNLLRSEGAEVVTVGDTRGALDALAGRAFHALLLDLMLPDGDGATVLEEVRRSHPVEPQVVLVVTGDVTPRRLTRLALRGRERLVPKPVDFTRLVRWLAPVADAVRAASPAALAEPCPA